MTIIIDPGHGLGNRRTGVYDPGACSEEHCEATIAMAWANELRGILMAAGHRVVRTRVDHKDPAPVGKRAAIAHHFGGEIMISLHCNAANGAANGTETFYRSESNREQADALNMAVVNALETRNRGVKLEALSQHARLAVMAFQPCFLIELGFIDHPGDRAKMLDPVLRKLACNAVARVVGK